MSGTTASASSGRAGRNCSAVTSSARWTSGGGRAARPRRRSRCLAPRERQRREARKQQRRVAREQQRREARKQWRREARKQWRREARKRQRREARKQWRREARKRQ